MPRQARACPGGHVYHIINRSNARKAIFEHEGDYLAFEQVLLEAHRNTSMRPLAYCIMPNHWHLVLWPREDSDMVKFMRWMTTTHAKRWHTVHETTGTGHLFQGRFKSFPVKTDNHFLTVCRYVEQNALRASFVTQAENWRWSSLWNRNTGTGIILDLLAEWPVRRPSNWLELVNQQQAHSELDIIRTCSKHGRPFGDDDWVISTAIDLELEYTLRSRGRPKKQDQATDNTNTGMLFQ